MGFLKVQQSTLLRATFDCVLYPTPPSSYGEEQLLESDVKVEKKKVKVGKGGVVRHREPSFDCLLYPPTTDRPTKGRPKLFEECVEFNINILLRPLGL